MWGVGWSGKLDRFRYASCCLRGPAAGVAGARACLSACCLCCPCSAACNPPIASSPTQRRAGPNQDRQLPSLGGWHRFGIRPRLQRAPHRGADRCSARGPERAQHAVQGVSEAAVAEPASRHACLLSSQPLARPAYPAQAGAARRWAACCRTAAAATREQRGGAGAGGCSRPGLRRHAACAPAPTSYPPPRMQPVHERARGDGGGGSRAVCGIPAGASGGWGQPHARVAELRQCRSSARLQFVDGPSPLPCPLPSDPCRAPTACWRSRAASATPPCWPAPRLVQPALAPHIWL